MGHDTHTTPTAHHAADDGKQNVRMITLVLALFFAMSALGHYVFVVRAEHGAEASSAKAAHAPKEH